jgi:hypothetical protein
VEVDVCVPKANAEKVHPVGADSGRESCDVSPFRCVDGIYRIDRRADRPNLDNHPFFSVPPDEVDLTPVNSDVAVGNR